MYDMKWDMGWAAVVYATMKELDAQNIKKNIVACLCLAENVVSSNAYKPSDILTWYTGKTVEIIHTDAEWRLVMADGISYIGKNYKTDRIISIATLTWACMVALWFRYAGIMWTDRKMLESLKSYSKEHTEKYRKWRTLYTYWYSRSIHQWGRAIWKDAKMNDGVWSRESFRVTQ